MRIAKKIRILITGLLILMFSSCARQAPTEKDGRLCLTAIFADGSGVIAVNEQLGYAPVAYSRVTLESRLYNADPHTFARYVAKTDSLGRAVFRDIPAADYIISLVKDTTYVNPENGATSQVTLKGHAVAHVYSEKVQLDTIKTSLSLHSDVVINEVYYCGPVNRAYYFYDQFVELYNASDSTRYLDGMILCRNRAYHNPAMDSLDYIQVIYVYQFPGEPRTGRTYPIEPHQFVVVAQDAADHSAYIDNALDLSGADWEFYNPYGGDLDNPDVPNVVNAIPGNSTDFMINLVHDAVILADGTGYYYGEVSSHGYQYIHVPVNTVLDAVEYSANSEKQKEITTRLDAGFAGVGIAKYSGKSTERRSAGFDTDNSSLDFINLDTPTPGWQHK